MSIYKANNNAYSALSASITASATTLSVLSGHGARFPVIGTDEYTRLTLQDTSNNIEIVTVTERIPGSDTFTVIRGQEGTTPLDWVAGSLVELRPTAGLVLTLDAVQEMQNKTIDGSKNTLIGLSKSERLTSVSGINAITATAAGFTAYADGQRFTLKPLSTNTGPVTLSINDGSALPVVKDTGVALEAGDFAPGAPVVLDCDGARFWAVAGLMGTSSAVDSALALKANLDSPIFTGVPKVPTATNAASPTPLAQVSNMVDAVLSALRAERRGTIVVSPATDLDGAILCAGTIVSKTTYANLWAWAQAKGLVLTEADWATRAGLFSDYSETHFRVPQLVGVVIRGHHNGSTRDPDYLTRLIGSYQADEFKLHGHPYFSGATGVSSPDGTGGFQREGNQATSYPAYTGAASAVTGRQIGGSGGAETRMKNVSQNFFMYY